MFTLLMEALASMLYFTGYIRSQSFARPLSREEEERSIALLAQKDAHAREQLIEHNLRLVAHIVKKYDIKKTQSDDLISIGTIGLIKAVDTFRPQMGKKLTTYASRCIENEILMYLRKNRNSFQEVSLNEPIAKEKDGSEKKHALDIAQGCGCESGCPSCVGPVSQVGEHGKADAIAILKELLA